MDLLTFMAFRLLVGYVWLYRVEIIVYNFGIEVSDVFFKLCLGYV